MKRDAYFDNARILLIFLVVFGHLIQPFVQDSHSLNTLYIWIYTFHMPAFIFLAGFFAKGSWNIKYIFSLVKKLLVPYLLFQLIYTGYFFFIGKSGLHLEMFYPKWSLWFLFSLFSWHILLIAFKKMPIAISIITAVALGLFVGYLQIGHTFSLSRTFVFFPFFVLGFWLTKEHITWLQQRSVKVASLGIMLLVAVIIYYSPDFSTGWLLASKSYSQLGLPEFGMFARLLVYIISVLMAMSVLAWVPKANSRITYLGTRTLYVYLLHGFFIQFFREFNFFTVNSPLDVLGLVVISALMVLVLSSKPIIGIWQPFIEGNATILKYSFNREVDSSKNI